MRLNPIKKKMVGDSICRNPGFPEFIACIAMEFSLSGSLPFNTRMFFSWRAKLKNIRVLKGRLPDSENSMAIHAMNSGKPGFRQMLSPTIFFLIGFNLILFTKRLILEDYLI